MCVWNWLWHSALPSPMLSPSDCMCALNALFYSHVWGGPLQHQPTQSTHTQTSPGHCGSFPLSSLYLNIKVAMTAAVPGKLLTTSQSMVLWLCFGCPQRSCLELSSVLWCSPGKSTVPDLFKERMYFLTKSLIDLKAERVSISVYHSASWTFSVLDRHWSIW